MFVVPLHFVLDQIFVQFDRVFAVQQAMVILSLLDKVEVTSTRLAVHLNLLIVNAIVLVVHSMVIPMVSMPNVSPVVSGSMVSSIVNSVIRSMIRSVIRSMISPIVNSMVSPVFSSPVVTLVVRVMVEVVVVISELLMQQDIVFVFRLDMVVHEVVVLQHHIVRLTTCAVIVGIHCIGTTVAANTRVCVVAFYVHIFLQAAQAPW